jgi:hypothetical protein
MARSTIQTRLCPHCANSIALDTLVCPYCKASVDTGPVVPQWPRADEDAPAVKVEPQRQGMPLGSKIILLSGLMLFALGVFLVGGQNEHSDLAPQLAAKDKELQEREGRIKSLEEQLGQAREELKGSAAQIEDFQSKLTAQEKSLAAAQKELKESRLDFERLASRSAAAPLPPVRTREPAASSPVPGTASRRALEPGLYETVRSTAVYEEPLGTSRVLTRISVGTQITVVRGVGEWLEVRSKHGNPPGFVRSDDAKLVGKAN